MFESCPCPWEIAALQPTNSLSPIVIIDSSDIFDSKIIKRKVVAIDGSSGNVAGLTTWAFDPAVLASFDHLMRVGFFSFLRVTPPPASASLG